MLVSIWLYALLSTGVLLVVVMAAQASTRTVRRMLRAVRPPAPAAVERARTASAPERVLVDSLRRP